MRAKIYTIKKRYALKILSSRFIKDNDVVMLPIIDELPEGATVHDMHYDWACQSLAVIVMHDSFEDIPDGQDLPRVYDATVTMQTFLVSNEHVVMNALELPELEALRDMVEDQIRRIKDPHYAMAH